MTDYRTKGAADADLVTRAAAIGLRTLDEKTRTVTFIASTDAVDSYDEIVEQSWRLDRFKSNPVILFGHNSRELPIGSATRCEVVKGALEVDVRFLGAEANPKAEQVWQCVKEGALRAVSVGFRPNEVRMEKRDGKEIYVLADNELHEISVVPIPANPEALAKMKSKAHARAGETPTDTRGASANGDHLMPNLALFASMLALAAPASATENDIAGAIKATKDKADKADVLAADIVMLREKLAAAEKTGAKLTEERDAALKAAKDADLRLAGAELDALIGVKIVPAEKEALLELAAENPKIYAKQIAAIKGRSDMAMGATIIAQRSADGGAPPTTGGGTGASDELASLALS